MENYFFDVVPDMKIISTYLVFAVTIIVLTRYWINARHQKEKIAESGARPLPGPWGIPIFGNMLSFDKDAPHLYLMKLAKVYGNVFQITLGSRPVLVLNGLKAIQNSLVKQSITFAGRPDMYTFKVINKTNIYGPSLSFRPYSEEYKRHRKHTETTIRHFTTGSQVAFVEKVASGEAKELVEQLKVPADDRSEEIKRLTRLSVSNIILWFMFKKRSSYHDKTYIAFIKSFDRFMKGIGSGNPLNFLPWLTFILTKTMAGFEESQAKFNKAARGLLDESHELFDPESTQDIMDETINSGHIGSELEFQDLSALSGEHLLQNAFDFFGAGFDTTASTLEWAMLYMAQYPQAQSDVQREIDEVVGRHRLPSWSDSPNLPLTQSCLLEVQRYATVSLFGIPHCTTKDTVLDGFFIPKDMVVFPNFYSVHFDPEVWHEPEVFDPRRFLSEDGALDDNKRRLMVAFGAGRRKCVGADFSRINLFTFFATLLHQLRFSCPDGEEVDLGFNAAAIMRPKNINVCIESRDTI